MSQTTNTNTLTKLCQVSHGMKVVLSICGALIKDAVVKLGYGADGKARVWFCQNVVSGSDNSNPFGYRYAFSVGVNCDGTLRLEKNGVAGLRAWTAADLAPAYTGPVYVLEDGSRVNADEYDRGFALGYTAAPGFRVVRMKVVAVEEKGVTFTNGTASAGMEFKTVAKFDGAIRDRRQGIEDLREEIADLNDEIADLNDEIADKSKAISKYQANKSRYNQFARKFGWAVV